MILEDGIVYLLEREKENFKKRILTGEVLIFRNLQV